MRNPVEGWILEENYGGWRIHWKASGYIHPDNMIIAVPYRVNGSRVDSTYEIPLYNRKHVNCIGRTVYLIEKTKVYIINPESIYKIRFTELKNKRGGIAELIGIINPEWIGLTGSWATLTEHPESDVDILVYDGNGWRIYNALEDLKNEGLITPCKGRYAVNLPRMRGFQLLDACYKGERYTIRILETLHASECNGSVIPIKWHEGLIRVTRQIAPHMVPALYEVEIRDLGRVVMETWHTRYQELSRGEYIARTLIMYSREGYKISPDLGGWIARINGNHI